MAEKIRARASRDGKTLERIPPRDPEAEPAAPPAARPDQITDDARTLWRETRMAGDHFTLHDGDGNEIARLPFTEENMRHYMGGPEGNAAKAESEALAALNEQRRAQALPELTSLSQIEEEERAARAARRRDGKNMRYTEKDSDRVKHNMRSRLAGSNATDEQKAVIGALIEQVRDTASAREVKTRLDALESGALQPERPRRGRRAEEAPSPPAPDVPESSEQVAPTIPDSNDVEDLLRSVNRPEQTPTPNEDIEDLLRKLGQRSPEQRRQMMQQGAGERTPEERRRRILERNNTRRRSAGPEQTPLPSDQEQNETERAPGTPPPLTPEQIEYSRRTSGGGAEQPPNEPPPPGASDTLQQPRGGRYEGAKKKGYTLDDREYAGLKPPTLKEIWADSIQQHFFGEMLRTIGTMNNEDTDAIVARYARDEATPDDLHFMNYVRHEYWKWTDAWQKLCKDLSDVDVEAFMRRNQMMKSIVGHVGDERGLEVLKQMLRFTAMRDQQTFQDIEHALHHAHDVRDTYLGRRAEKKINHLAGEIGVDRSEYHKIVNFSSDEERRRSEEDIENRLHKKADGVRKAMDWMYNKTGFGFIPGTSHKAMKQFVRRAELAERGHFGRTGKQLDGVAASMGHAGKDLSKVVETREVISMVSQEALRNERRVPEYLSGPKSIAEVNTTINAVNEQGLKQIITQRTQQPDYVNGTPAYQNSVISDLRKDAEKTLNAGTGFMSWILKMLFGSKFNKAASEVTGRTIH